MMERITQLRDAWRTTREHDPQLPLWVFVPAGVTFLVVLLVGLFVLDSPVLFPILAVLAAATVGMVMFGRRAQSAQYDAIEGQPGAAAAVLNVMRGQWFVSPAVAFSKKQDLVHRVVGRCGIVLVGEGSSPARVKQLVGKERTRLARIAGDVPLHTVIVGDGSGDTVSLDRLQVTMTKFPRELKKNEVPRLERKLKPLDRDLPMPKGYMPNPGKKMR